VAASDDYRAALDELDEAIIYASRPPDPSEDTAGRRVLAAFLADTAIELVRVQLDVLAAVAAPLVHPTRVRLVAKEGDDLRGLLHSKGQSPDRWRAVAQENGLPSPFLRDGDVVTFNPRETR